MKPTFLHLIPNVPSLKLRNLKLRNFVASLFIFSIVCVSLSEAALYIPRELTFEIGSAELTLDSKNKLLTLAETLQDQGLDHDHIKIIGYCDPKSSVQENNALAKDRADNVRTFLVKNGVNKRLLSAKATDSIETDTQATGPSSKDHKKVELILE